MTKIKDYMTQFKIKIKTIAAFVEVNPFHFSRIAHGHKATSPQTIKLTKQYLQNLLDKRKDLHDKEGMEIAKQQELLDAAIEELNEIRKLSKQKEGKGKNGTD